MKGYLYETHLHTSQASACGKVQGADYIDYMMRRGFHGMIVTDHFFNGNSAVEKTLPWKERIDRYASGYHDALEAAKGKDFDVLFGVEYNFKGDEYLIYGIDEAWLKENEDIMSLSRSGVYERVHQTDAIMIHAHPYRERGYLSDIKLTPSICDGIEVYNAANPDYQNALGYAYAKRLKLPVTAGSDIHYFFDGAMGGMLLPHRIGDISGYVSAVRAGEAVPVRISPDKRITPVSEVTELTVVTKGPTLPVYELDG